MGSRGQKNGGEFKKTSVRKSILSQPLLRSTDPETGTVASLASSNGGAANATPFSPRRGSSSESVPPGGLVVTSVDEVPPPSYTTVTGGTPVVTCRVCQGMIDISGKREQHVVKCPSCSEATPIRNAPPGRKYVRCPCNCLLICKTPAYELHVQDPTANGLLAWPPRDPRRLPFLTYPACAEWYAPIVMITFCLT